ncbi:MAG: ATP-binding protein [Coriobacteriales bacterium]|jgi:hypothetical protein|nr:ATP-binding protein [Coriobacteriales bacterium]
MGIYLNPGNAGFRQSVNSAIYVDKTGLIAYANSVLETEQKCLCVSRPRRFGKSMAAEMLCAYYDRSADSRELFAPFEIAGHPSFERCINRYDVLYLNMIDFLTQSQTMQEMTALLQSKLRSELLAAYGSDACGAGGLTDTLSRLGLPENGMLRFVVIIDEWDCVFREWKGDLRAQKDYLSFLRSLLKDKPSIALAYMTGILPIKKYGAHSALNMFDEFSMEDQLQLARYTGFTEDEVQALCADYGRDAEDFRVMYNGYLLQDSNGTSYEIYNPRSVVKALQNNNLSGYWTRTETYEALRVYIDLDFDGLRDKVTALLAGERVPTDTSKFQNDMTTFTKADDVLTLLVHLGYLGLTPTSETDGLDSPTGEVFVPNKEILAEYRRAMEDGGWPEVMKAVQASKALLDALWERDAASVAAGIEAAHLDTAHITYNSEAALSYTVSLALFAARDYYTLVRELPSGKGFVDIAFIPRPNRSGIPAMLLELKWDAAAETAISQIRDRHYPDSLAAWSGTVLVAGISYDKKTRTHSCVIESA